MYVSNSHSYTHLILALGIVREPTVWGFISSKYSGIYDIGLPNTTSIKIPKELKAAVTLPQVHLHLRHPRATPQDVSSCPPRGDHGRGGLEPLHCARAGFDTAQFY